MSVCKDWLDVVIGVIILLEAISVLAWMDMNWNQIITLVQVIKLTTYVELYSIIWLHRKRFNVFSTITFYVHKYLSIAEFLAVCYVRRYVYSGDIF